MTIRDNGDGTLTRTGLPEAALRALDPYGVPTGAVPRVGSYEEAVARMKTIAELSPATRRPYPPDHPLDGTRALPDFGVAGAAIQQAVDNYILMERKAQAWDKLRASLLGEPQIRQRMDQLLSEGAAAPSST